MPNASFDASRLNVLTDVQLLHHLNDALRSREADRSASRVSVLLRLAPFRGSAWYSFVVLGAELVGALEVTLLALRLASQDQLDAWALRCEARMRSVADDIAILRFLNEMERRVAARGMPTHEPDPEFQRG